MSEQESEKYDNMGAGGQQIQHVVEKDYIEKLIEQKNDETNPVLVTRKDARNMITDMNQFPYLRQSRGRPGFSRPIVMAREAGYCPVDRTEIVVNVKRNMYNPDIKFINNCNN
tara:strand:+ start:847 stop:1185 length:339 start_codon:yes stop_codon:yes gene_type:complete